ncbi:MAG TPA: DUF3300 domain-containing protein [Opitutaceae bacterium]|nr:DUF3300 domain-containing protein [Opitutaceae bacterium]
MKIRHLITLGVGAITASAAFAQYSYPPAPAPAPTAYPPTATAAPEPALAPAQLDQLLSPVALYPDPLLGMILPASTEPDQIGAAASFVSASVDPAQIDQQPWDDSVKALAHYPDVITWMAQNTDWTNQLGQAVATEEPEVMDSIQRLRSNALASGLLVNTPQQQVVVQNSTISIVPTQSGTVYVPTYDPAYVESRTPVRGGIGIRFGAAYPLGAWALFGLDWRAHDLWIDHDRHDEAEHDWRRVAGTSESHQVWHPTRDVAHWQPERQPNRDNERRPVAQPRPLAHRSSAWSERTQTPGLTPTGRMTPGIERNYPPRYNQTMPARVEGRDVPPRNDAPRRNEAPRHQPQVQHDERGRNPPATRRGDRHDDNDDDRRRRDQ